MSLSLSQETLEALLIAVTQAKDADGKAVNLPPAWVFTQWLLNQLPEGLK